LIRQSTWSDRESMNAKPSMTTAKPAGGAEWVTAERACRILGVKAATLYAYASRGLVRSAAGPRGGRARVYQKEDLERLKTRSMARSGHAAVAAGALRWGEPVLETRVGAIRQDGPVYRGRSAIALARDGARFEDVCVLLWDGAPFTPEGELDERRLGASATSLRALLPTDAEPFDGMLITAAALAANEARGETQDVARDRAPALVRRLIAACGLGRGTDAVTASLEAEGCARALLVALGGKTTKASVSAMNEALIVIADHELNPSTFAARVAASAGASTTASIAAALGALSGPLHGAATARVEARAASVVAARLDRGESVPGFGHPLYTNGDPRGERLIELANRLGSRQRGVRVLSSIVAAMDLVSRELPTVDVGLVALASALGLRRGAALAIFASGRVAGWIAHVLEQKEAGFMLRPRARYVGA
jgi:citrate synthase